MLIVWGQMLQKLDRSHKMLEENPICIWRLQTKTNHFQHVSNFFPAFGVFYRPDENIVIK